MDRLKLELRWLCRRSAGSFSPVAVLRFALPLLFAVVAFGDCVCCSGQIVIRQGGININLNGLSGDEEKPDVESGGVLKTDPDLESILQKAERYKDDGNYFFATKIWQEVLNRSGDSLYSADGTTYFSLVQQVEAIIANLPPEGLAAYRVLADAEAKEILAQASGPSDTEALNKIVRSFFASSVGDEAAYSLGCVYLDQYDFTGARRLFEKIVNQHPDPSMPLDEIYSRIALCQAFLGDAKMAESSLKVATDFNENSEQVELIRRSLARLGDVKSESSYLDSWLNPMGDARRYGTMPPLPKDAMSQDLAAVWQFYFDPQEVYKNAADVSGQMLFGAEASGEDALSTVDNLEERLIGSWRDKGWRPAGHLLFEADRVYFKTGSDVSVWNKNEVAKLAQRTGASPVGSSGAVKWRSVWHNVFRLDETTQMLEMVRQNFSRGRRTTSRLARSSSPVPTGMTEVQFFGDQIYQQMSIHQGQMYAIEGKSFGVSHRTVKSTARPQWNSSVRRTRTNFLTAYDAVSGEVKWTLPRELDEANVPAAEVILEDETESSWIANGGFMSAPIGYGDTILVPVNTGGAISIYALDPNQEGKTIWKSFLCDEPETGAVPWSAVNLSIEGSDLFVSCGMGVVFVLDPASGAVRFAKRYQRYGSKSTTSRNNWLPNRLSFDGWSSDLIVPYRGLMVCLNSDSDWIIAYDRNSGKMIWKSEMSPFEGKKLDYILGIYDDVLYAAGTESIVAYDLQGGAMIWACQHLPPSSPSEGGLAGGGGSEAKLKAEIRRAADSVFDDGEDSKQSLGRGLVTPDGVYLPVEDTIYHFDLKGYQGIAKVIGRVHVDLGTLAPVGNLYSDGERFWVHGANRIYALGPANEKPDSKKGALKTKLPDNWISNVKLSNMVPR